MKLLALLLISVMGMSFPDMHIVHLRMSEMGKTPVEKIALNCMANLLVGESGYPGWEEQEEGYALASGVIAYFQGDWDKWLDNALWSIGTNVALHTILQKPFYDNFGDPMIPMDAGKTKALSQFMLFSYAVKI
jgi:hypothetical protein